MASDTMFNLYLLVQLLILNLNSMADSGSSFKERLRTKHTTVFNYEFVNNKMNIIILKC